MCWLLGPFLYNRQLNSYERRKGIGGGGKGKKTPFHCLWYAFYLGEGMLFSTNVIKQLKICKMAFFFFNEFSYNSRIISVLIAATEATATAAPTPPLCP